MAIVIPYVTQTWTDGVSSCSAARNNVHEDGIRDAHLQPAVRVFHNAAQAIVTATDTVLAFNSERFDQAGGASAAHHDTVTNNSRLTCLYAGVYMISATVQFASNATGIRIVKFRVNGTTLISADVMQAVNGATTNMAHQTLYSLAVNDYVECLVQQTSGANLNIDVSGNFSPEFMMSRVA